MKQFYFTFYERNCLNLYSVRSYRLTILRDQFRGVLLYLTTYYEMFIYTTRNLHWRLGFIIPHKGR